MEVEEETIDQVIAVSKAIPSFEAPPERAEYKKRLPGAPHLISVAYEAAKAIGFKVGYQRSVYFYSWMGGVLPNFRRLGIAKASADYQEEWAKQNNYFSITFKTRNQHNAMLLFALKNEFVIIDFEEKESVATNRI
jgi:ribosomal protein S18 acetylase RimI-like enzyme